MRRIWIVLGAACVAVLCFSALAMAAGPHDMDCMDCHSTHYAEGDFIVGVKPYAPENPARTRGRMNADQIDALCLGCHNDEQGILPINLHRTHPTGIAPEYTAVPGELLNKGTFTCVSCHNPHPSNANYKYLITATGDGANMGVFCAKCHPDQSDADVMTQSASTPMSVDPNVEPIVKISQ